MLRSITLIIGIFLGLIFCFCDPVSDDPLPTVTPIVDSIGDTVATVRWHDVGSAYTYKVYVVNVNEGNSKTVNTNRDTVYTITNLTSKTDYNVGIITVDDEGAPGLGTLINFTTN